MNKIISIKTDLNYTDFSLSSQFITTISDPSELLPIKIVSKDIHGTASIINNNTNYIDIANNYAQLYGGKVIYQKKQMNLRYTLDNLNNGDELTDNPSSHQYSDYAYYVIDWHDIDDKFENWDDTMTFLGGL